MAKIDWVDSLPGPEVRRITYSARIDSAVVEEIDAFRRQHKANLPWLCATRSLFIETAVRHLLKTLKSTGAG